MVVYDFGYAIRFDTISALISDLAREEIARYGRKPELSTISERIIDIKGNKIQKMALLKAAESFKELPTNSLQNSLQSSLLNYQEGTFYGMQCCPQCSACALHRKNFITLISPAFHLAIN